MSRIPMAMVVLMSSLAGSAFAQEVQPATKEDLAVLQQEVRDLRAILLRMLEVEETRLRGMSDLLYEARGGRMRAPADTRPRTPDAPSESRAESRVEPRTAAGTVSGRVVVRGVTKPVAYAYIENLPGKLVRNQTVEIRQREKLFVPAAIAVQRGTKVIFPNEDKIFHNVFSLTPGASFDLGTYRAGDKPGSYVFTQPGIVEVFCNLHSQMNASVLIVPNAFFAKANADGSFTLANVPPGRHRIAAWTPNVAPVVRTIDVVAGEQATVELTLDAKEGPPAHTDKNGMPYGSYR